MYYYILGKGSIMQACKHLTRLGRGSLLRGSYRLSLVPLTKPVQSCKGLTDTSGTRLFPLALHHAGGVGNAPV